VGSGDDTDGPHHCQSSPPRLATTSTPARDILQRRRPGAPARRGRFVL